MSTLKNAPGAFYGDDTASHAAASGAMLVAWARRTMQRRTKRIGSGPVRGCALIVRTPGASNPIAAPNFICANFRQWIRRIESILRSR